MARHRGFGSAPRPRPRPGAKRGSLSSNGRPGTRQGVRTPHLRAAMPVDAYSLAVSCGGRGVSCDIWPAGLVRHAPRRALPVLRARRGSPRPARSAAPRPFAATPVSPALRVSAPCGFLPSVVPPPSPRYRGCGGPCPAMRRPPTPLRCGLALGRHLLSVTPSRRALPSRPRRAWRPIDAGHSSRASPRRHQLSSYRNACRHWPEDRFCAPSLPGFSEHAEPSPSHLRPVDTVGFGSDGAPDPDSPTAPLNTMVAGPLTFPIGSQATQLSMPKGSSHDFTAPGHKSHPAPNGSELSHICFISVDETRVVRRVDLPGSTSSRISTSLRRRHRRSAGMYPPYYLETPGRDYEAP